MPLTITHEGHRNLIKTVSLKDGAEASLLHLDHAHLTNIKSLHDLVRDHLPAEEKSFILPRTIAYFERHFARGNGSILIGIEQNGILIAKAVILHPEENCAPDDLGGAFLTSPPEKTSILQAATVHPDYQGNGAMQLMVQYWMDYAKAQSKTHVMAEIEVNNHKSWSTFLKIGLNIIRVGKSPIDGADVYSAQERIKYGMTMELDPTNSREERMTVECALHEIDKQKNLLDSGYKVVEHNRKDGTLILRKIN